jgi:hypothetical protein
MVRIDPRLSRGVDEVNLKLVDGVGGGWSAPYRWVEECVTEALTDKSQCKGARLMSRVEDDTGTTGVVCCTDQD